jgi:hypothetical protein
MIPGLAPFAFPIPSLPACLQNPPQITSPRVRFQLEKLTIEADEVEWQKEGLIRRFKGNVKASYEALTLTSEEAEISEENQTAEFRKGVLITAQDVGEIHAEQVFIRYGEHRGGFARGIQIHAHEASFQGDLLEVEPGVWRLKGAKATTCERHTPDYLINLPDVVFKPSRFIAGRDAYIQFGKLLRVPVPFFHVGLNPQQTGIQPPTPTINEEFKIGYRWRNVFALNRQTSFLYEQIANQDAVPYVNAQLAYTTKPRTEDDLDKMITIRNEDRERFQNSYLDNVIVPSLLIENRSLAYESLTFFVGRSTNVNTVARPGEPERLDREAYGGVEFTTRLDRWNTHTHLRFGPVKERGTPESLYRAEIYSTIFSPLYPMAPNVFFRIRGDIGAFLGDGKDSLWLRPLVTVHYAPTPSTSFTLGYFQTLTSGSPQFDADRLYSSHALHFRTDVNLPATNLSVLMKYDFDRKRVYDIEVSLRQVAHCITPFFAYRQFPGSFTFGFELRAEKLFNALKRRDVTTTLKRPR